MKPARATAISTGSVRLRARQDGSFVLTLVEPERGFCGLLTSTGRSRRRVITTATEHTWSQVEVEQRIGPGRRVVSRTIVTTNPVVDGAFEIVWSKLSRDGSEIARSVTIIDRDGEIRWKNYGRGGAPLGEGAARAGVGSGVDNQGRRYTWDTQGSRTTVTTQLSDGDTRTETTFKRPHATITDLEIKDANGRTTIHGTKTEDLATGGWTRTSVSSDGHTTFTITDTGTRDSAQTTHRRTEVNGEVTREERSVCGNDGRGKWSKTSSEIDYAAGTVTIITTSRGAAGGKSQHITVTDLSGNLVGDPTAGIAAGSGSRADDASPSGISDDSDNGGDDPDDGGDGWQDPNDDEIIARCPGWKRGGHEGDVPTFPGGVVGSILNDLGIFAGGDPDEGENLAETVWQRVRRVIAFAHNEPSADGLGVGGNDVGIPISDGTLEIDIRMPAPPGAVDDWGDGSNPGALVDAIADHGIALATVGSELRRVGQVLGGSAP